MPRKLQRPYIPSVAVPALFYDDYSLRAAAKDTPKALRTSRRTATIALDDPAMASFYSDAVWYAGNIGPGPTVPRIQRSAGATLRALDPVKHLLRL